MDPSIVTKRFITSRQDTPIGNINNVFDGNVDTQYKLSTSKSYLSGEITGWRNSSLKDIYHIHEVYLGRWKESF